MKNKRNDEILLIIFNVKGKKNNQSSISNADVKFQPSGQWIMPETFPALSVYHRLGCLGLHRRPVFDSITSFVYAFS